MISQTSLSHHRLLKCCKVSELSGSLFSIRYTQQMASFCHVERALGASMILSFPPLRQKCMFSFAWKE